MNRYSDCKVFGEYLSTNFKYSCYRDTVATDFLLCSSWSSFAAHLDSKAIITTDLFFILKTPSKIAFFFFFAEGLGSKVKQKQGKLIIHAAL